MSAKQPKQERSRALFNSILEATTQLLNKTTDRNPDAKLTTSGIAERAGVSIGSLYQYFKSADSIVGEVLKDRMERDVREIWAAFEAGRELELEAQLRLVFQKILSTHLPLGRARTTLFKKVVSLKLVEFAQAQIETLAQKMFLELQKQNKIRADLPTELATYLLSRTVFSVTMSATIDHEKMNTQQAELSHELARMIACYVGPTIR
jgi:AcrR family transcriptional regulator